MGTEEKHPDPLAVTVAGDPADASGPIETPLAPGTLVGRYVVTGVLGSGGMGVVYAAHDPDLDRPLAIKLLRRELRTARARLLREGQAIAKLMHPNVVVVHDVGAHGDDLFIAMERVRGTTLGAWMRAAGDARRPWREVLERLVPAGRGLAAAHAAGLVHRDFKPENVLLGEDGRVVVTDFGLAQVGDEPSPPSSPGERPRTPLPAGPIDHTHTGAVLGTPAYMSPEQARGERTDTRSDQYSFCVTLHEALYGVRPEIHHARLETVANPGQQSTRLEHLASGADPTHVAVVAPARGVPRWLRGALARGLARDPAARFGSMNELLLALEPPRRVWLAGVGVIIAAAAVIAWLVLRPSQREQAASQARARCDLVAAAVESVWTSDARRAYRDRERIQPIDDELAWIDDYARRWSRARREVCLARPGTLHPRADACLDAALDDLRAAVARSDAYWPALRSLDDCRAAPRAPVTFPVTVGVGPQGVAVLSPDARRIAVSGLDGDPYVIAADPKAPQPEPVIGARLVGDWLPDGRLLVQLADGRQVLRPATGGPDQPLPGTGDLLFTQVNTIAPDGSRIAVADEIAVTVLATSGGAVLATVPGPAHELAWEPDGRRLAIVSRDLSTLTLLDTRNGGTTRLPIGLHSRGLGEIGTAWLAPGRLVVSGAISASTTFGVFSLELNDGSRHARAPELRYRPPTPQILRLFDAAAGQVLLHNASGRQRLLRWHEDRVTEYPASFKDIRIIALDRTRALALGLSGDQLHLFDVGTGTRTMVSADDVTHAFGGLRDGRAFQARRLAPEQWELVERTPTGEGQRLSFTWRADQMTPLIRCAPSAPQHCVLTGRAGDTLVYARVTGDTVGPLHRITGVTGAIDVAADGKRLVAPYKDARVAAIDIDSGKVTVLASTGLPCTARHARQDPDEPDRFWMVHLCADRFAIGEIRAGGTYREVAASDGWISGIEVLAGGELVYSAMDWDPQLQLLPGL